MIQRNPFAELTQTDWLAGIWQALRRIEDNMALPPAPLELPAPIINLQPPDLTEITAAVDRIRPGVDPGELARALAVVIGPPPPPSEIPGIAEFNEAVKELSWRLKSVGAQAYGGGAVSFAPGQLDPISAGLVGIARGVTDYESRLDYDVRTDAQPVYVGRALNGTATSAGWTIEKVTYDGADRPTRKQVLTGAWDNRATLNW